MPRKYFVVICFNVRHEHPTTSNESFRKYISTDSICFLFRKYSLLINNSLVICGGIFLFCSKEANSVALLIIGRILVGLNAGKRFCFRIYVDVGDLYSPSQYQSSSLRWNYPYGKPVHLDQTQKKILPFLGQNSILRVFSFACLNCTKNFVLLYVVVTRVCRAFSNGLAYKYTIRQVINPELIYLEHDIA